MVTLKPRLSSFLMALFLALIGSSRVKWLLRPSGTEPVVRVMVEAAGHETAQSVAKRLAVVVSTELALELVD